jgi:hypothetical protein
MEQEKKEEFEKEFEKLKSYYGTDLEAFKEQYSSMCSQFGVEKVKSNLKQVLHKSLNELDDKIATLTVKMQLGNTIDVIPLSYIAGKYFKKSRFWLYQRVKGNIVNGKPAKFTPEEKEIFNFALQDISKQIGSVQIS